MSVLISIVIPLYRSGRTIGEVLKSLEAMDFSKERVELLLIYYPTNDDTLKVVQEFLERNRGVFHDIRVIPRGDRCANVARNLGVKLSRGKYIMLLNDDIVLPPNVLRKAIEIFNSNPLVGAVTFPYVLQPPRVNELAMFLGILVGLVRLKC